MPVRTRARNEAEFINLIDQAIDEIEDLRAAIEYDEEFMGEASIVVEPLSNGLTSLLSAVKQGDYQLGESDHLDFLFAMKAVDHRAVPFWPLLKLILETHQLGYQGET